MRRASIRSCGALVPALAAILMGCRGGTPTSITFTTLGGLETEAIAFREVFSGFTRETGVRVELELLPDVNLYESAIKTRFAANNQPEIFYFFAGPNAAYEIKNGHVIALGNVPSSSLGTVRALSLAAEGNVWGIMRANDTEGPSFIVHNKKG